MHRYRQKPVEIQAHRWWRNGDHPEDGVGERTTDPITGGSFLRLEGAVVRFYRNPQVDGQDVHAPCGVAWRCHGWLCAAAGRARKGRRDAASRREKSMCRLQGDRRRHTKPVLSPGLNSAKEVFGALPWI